MAKMSELQQMLADFEREGLDWARAKADAEWLARSTRDDAERNLARAYLALLAERGGQ